MKLQNKKSTILIIGSDHLSRMGIKNILSCLGDVSFAEDSSSEINDNLTEKSYDLIIFVISTSEEKNIEILKKIKKVRPKSPVMIFDTYNEWNGIQAVMSGAKAYLNKMSSYSEIFESAKMLLDGKMYMTESLAEQIALALSARSHSPEGNQFSSKELQILRFMAVGNSNKQIAEQLDLSLQYVSYLKSKLRKKIGMRTNEEILKYALRTGLVSRSHLAYFKSL